MSWMPDQDSVVSSRKERIQEAKEDWKNGRCSLCPSSSAEMVAVMRD